MNFDIPYFICNILAFVPAIVLHEVAHGFAAYKLGDPTAKSAGRLSLNPLKHVDPFGTVLMPLMLMILNWPVFGYAKPVPYNPRFFKDPRKGDLIVGLAGPAANLVQACIGAGIMWALKPMASTMLYTSEIFAYIYLLFLPLFVLLNLYLMFFNLLPIPPLDGSSILAIIIPQKHLGTYYRVQQYALPVFMLLILVVPYVLHINPVGAYLHLTAVNLANLMLPIMI